MILKLFITAFFRLHLDFLLFIACLFTDWLERELVSRMIVEYPILVMLVTVRICFFDSESMTLSLNFERYSDSRHFLSFFWQISNLDLISNFFCLIFCCRLHWLLKLLRLFFQELTIVWAFFILFPHFILNCW